VSGELPRGLIAILLSRPNDLLASGDLSGGLETTVSAHADRLSGRELSAANVWVVWVVNPWEVFRNAVVGGDGREATGTSSEQSFGRPGVQVNVLAPWNLLIRSRLLLLTRRVSKSLIAARKASMR
jgi:hypothetical protein